VDFKVNLSQINKCFSYWKKSLWFAPDKFFDNATVKDVSQVLVPHWLFNVACNVTIKATVLLTTVDPYTHVPKHEWREIYDQKSSHITNFLCLATPINVPHYLRLLDNAKSWEPSILLEDIVAANSTGWFSNLLRSFVGLEKTDKKSIPEHPLLPVDNWLSCFDRHCRKKLEELEVEPATLYLKKKKGYSDVKDISITVNDVTSNFTKTLFYLPLFICVYQYSDNFFTLIINGINGNANGERPFSPLGQLAQAGVTGFQALDSFFRGKK